MKDSGWLDATSLSDPTRRGVLLLLVEGERTVGQLAESFELSPSSSANHLRVLESAGLLRQRRKERERYGRLDPKPLTEAVDRLNRYEVMWKRALGSLAEVAAPLQGTE